MMIMTIPSSGNINRYKEILGYIEPIPLTISIIHLTHNSTSNIIDKVVDLSLKITSTINDTTWNVVVQYQNYYALYKHDDNDDNDSDNDDNDGTIDEIVVYDIP